MNRRCSRSRHFCSAVTSHSLYVRVMRGVRCIASGKSSPVIPWAILQTVRSYGLIGTSTLSIPEHLILHAKTDDAREDLRIGAPFPALRSYVDAVNLQSLDELEFGHIPLLVLLIKALDEWRRLGFPADVSDAALTAAVVSLRQMDFSDTFTAQSPVAQISSLVLSFSRSIFREPGFLQQRQRKRHTRAYCSRCVLGGRSRPTSRRPSNLHSSCGQWTRYECAQSMTALSNQDGAILLCPSVC